MSSQLFYSFNEEYVLSLFLKNISVTTYIDDFLLFWVAASPVFGGFFKFSIYLDYTSFFKNPSNLQERAKYYHEILRGYKYIFALRLNKQTIES